MGLIWLSVELLLLGANVFLFFRDFSGSWMNGVAAVTMLACLYVRWSRHEEDRKLMEAIQDLEDKSDD